MNEARTTVRRCLALLVTLLSGVLLAIVGSSPASASVTSVSGRAFGYQTNVSLFGGPPGIRGYQQVTCTSTNVPAGCVPADSGPPFNQPASASASPAVQLPAAGSASALTQNDPDGARGTYGPAAIYAGRWPANVSQAPPSGPMSVSTQGTPAGGSVTSAAHVVKHTTPVPAHCVGDPAGTTNCTAPGGIGPGPVEADEVHSTCTASETGLTGSTTVTNGTVWIADPNPDASGEPGEVTATPPPNPAPGTEYSGVVAEVGDYFTVVFNEQVLAPDSITVNAVHMYLEGPTAVGEMVIGQSQCGVVATSANQAPVANNDAYSTPAGTPLTVTAPGLLANDTDPESGALTASKLPRTPPYASDPPHGSLTLSANGSFTYTSDPGYSGIDTFTYKAQDPRGWSDEATVTITVTNGAPVAGDNIYSIDDATSGVAAPGVLGNDIDPDGDALTAVSASDPPQGSVTLNANGSFTYTPDGVFDGHDSFTYDARDTENASDTATVTITTTGANAAPVAKNDTYNVFMDTPVTVAAPGVLSNDTDADGDALTAGSASDPTGGSVTLNANGSFTYTPDAGFEGFDNFTYVVNDGKGGTGTGTVSMVVPPGATKLSINNAWVTEGNAGTSVANFTITRAGSLAGTSSVRYNTTNGTAVAAGDYAAVSPAVTVNFAVGESSKTVAVNVVGDTLPELHETFNVVLSVPVGATIADTTGVGTIQNDDGAAYASVGNVWVSEGNAGTSTANFTISRTGNTNGTSTVSYATSNGTAVAGTDYTAIPVTPVTFAAGETSKPVSVTIAGDTLPEGHETFNVSLSAPVGVTLSDALGVGTIQNDDAQAYLAVNDVVVTEGNAGTTVANFTITRTGNTTGSSTVSYATVNSTAAAPGDFTAVPLTPVTFAAGETTKPIAVTVNGDVADEVNETFTVNLSAAVGAVAADASGIGTIVDDDGAITAGPTTFYSVSDVSVIEGNVGTTATFTVNRSGNTAGTGSVSYVTANTTAAAPGDYTAKTTTVLGFAAGETSKPVAVNVVGDTLTEADETFKLNLSAPVGGIVSDNSGIATVVNDDFTAYAVGDLQIVEGDAGTTVATFNVVRTGNTTGTGSVNYNTTNGTAVAPGDYTAKTSTLLSFAAGETSKPVTVNVNGDAAVEADEAFSLTLTLPVAGVLADTAGTATVVNDDFAQLSINDQSVTEGNAGTKVITFTARRSGATAGTASFRWATSGGTATAGSDYTAVPVTSVTFAAGETAKLLSVTVAGDALVEGHETFNVNLTLPVGMVVADTAGVGTITNDDV